MDFLLYFDCFLYFLSSIIILSTLDDFIYSNNSSKKNRFSNVFSLYTNGKSLFNFEAPENSISCIHGIKTLSMMIIVFCHSYQKIFYSTSLRNDSNMQHFKQRLMLTTFLATDNFFVLSGFLSVKCFMQKDFALCRYFRTIFLRYMRLIPTAAFLILILISLKNFQGLDGYLVGQNGDCEKYWWTSMLLIQSYYNPNNTCIGPLWFTAVCWHIFLITPIILKLLKFSNRLIRMSVIIALLVCTFIPGYIRSFGSDAILGTYTDTRSYPYIFGVLYYYEFFKIKKLSKYLKILLWIICLVILLSPAEIIFNSQKSIETLTKTFKIIRILWPFGMCWLIHACHYGWGGIINKILSLKYFMPFSNISLGLYIMNDYVGHYIGPRVIDHTNGIKYPVDRIIIMFIMTYIISTIVAAVLYLCIEVPFFKIGKIIADSSCFSNLINSKFRDKINYTKLSNKSEIA